MKKPFTRKPVSEMSNREFDHEVGRRTLKLSELILHLRSGMHNDEDGEMRLSHAALNRMLASFCASFEIQPHIAIGLFTEAYEKAAKDHAKALRDIVFTAEQWSPEKS